MFIDTMQQVYTNVSKVLIESRAGSNLLYLPLDKILQMTGQGGAAATSDAAVPASGATPPAPLPASPAPAAPADSRSRDAARTRDRETR
jgi:membrane protease subunit HflK